MVAMEPGNDSIGTDKGSEPVAARPVVKTSVRARVESLWKKTNNVPDFDRAVAAWRECQKALYPSWFDRTDAFRGMQPKELETREYNRKVRVNRCYRNTQQMVAMLVPDDYDLTWEPIPQVGESTDSPILKRFADTITAETKAHLAEIHWQDIVQGYAQDSVSFRIGCMKVVYDSAYIGSPVTADNEDKSKQANVQRLRVLVEDFNRRVFTKENERFEEMMELKESLGVDGELESWAGIRGENIPLDCIRVCPTIRDIDRIHLSPWISHDVLMQGDEIRAKFPYSPNEDGTWTGVHPDDIGKLTGTNSSNKVLGDTFWTTQTMAGAGTSAQASPESEAQTKRYLVREVWSRENGSVEILVEGLEYPAAKWSPVRTPSCWYPFRFFRFNRVQGTIYGISDVELTKDIQARINSKLSDEEKARWLSINRYIYDTQGIDGQEVIKLKDVKPGEFKGINLQGQKPADAIFPVACEMNQESFDVARDDQDMRQMAVIPEQMQGVTGRADFAVEVQAAQSGAAISFNSRGAMFRREFEAMHHHIAELLVQELTPEQVKLDCGPNAAWPVVYSDAEGKRLYAEIEQQAKQELQQQQSMAQDQAAQAAMFAPPGSPPPAPVPTPNEDEASSALAEIIGKKCTETFGFPEPITREVIFRRLRCKVTVAINAAADRAQQGQSIMQLFQALQAGGQAAQSAGMSFDPAPLLKMAGKPEWAEMFTKNPAQVLGTFMQLAQSAGPQSIPPELAVQVFQFLAPIAQQAMMAAQQQPQATAGQPPPAAAPGSM